MSKYVYNPETLMYDVVDEPKHLRTVRIWGLALLTAGLVVLYFWLYTSVFGWELPKTARLRRINASWEAKMEVLDRQAGLFDRTLTALENRDDDVYRAIYGLNEVPDNVKYSGLGGIHRYDELDNSGADVSLQRMVRRLDGMTKRAYVQSMALDEVSIISRQAGDMISCVPSVPPILPEPGSFRLSSSFGYRRDPVYGGGEYHEGQDIATDRGNPVYATGDGVVEAARFQFNGYGNEVVVNHGYGYTTRYAHLSTIIIKEGMTVHRGDKLGEVGNTGKSTGPHLHYEVIYRGKPVNPMNYMDINMPVSEYRAMIEKRREESPIGKKSTTSELLNRRRGGE